MNTSRSIPQHDPRIWPQVDEAWATVVRQRMELLIALKTIAIFSDPSNFAHVQAIAKAAISKAEGR